MFKKELLRQLKKSNSSLDNLPDNKINWENFLELINHSYIENENFREYLESLTDAFISEMDSLQKQLSSKYEGFIEMTPSLVLWLNESLQVENFNNSFEKEFLTLSINGIKTQKEININQIWEDKVVLQIKNFLSSNLISRQLEFQTLQNDNKQFYKFLVKKILIGKQTLMVFSGVNITDEKKTLEELSQLQSKMISDSKFAALGEMALGVAHEINNPMAVIQGSSNIIRKKLLNIENLDPMFLNKLDMIDKATKRVTQIVSGLRVYARDASNDPFVVVSIADIINETNTLYLESFTKNNIQVEISKINPDFNVLCRPNQISQVLLNLLNNSKDAISEQENKWIRLAVEEVSEFYKISITDSGHGIAKEIVDKILQPFFTTKETGKGTGLGLSISKGIIESHQGRFEYNSSNNHTEFFFLLPKYKETQAKAS